LSVADWDLDVTDDAGRASSDVVEDEDDAAENERIDADLDAAISALDAGSDFDTDFDNPFDDDEDDDRSDHLVAAPAEETV
jgi:hypothetical protein